MKKRPPGYAKRQAEKAQAQQARAQALRQADEQRAASRSAQTSRVETPRPQRTASQPLVNLTAGEARPHPSISFAGAYTQPDHADLYVSFVGVDDFLPSWLDQQLPAEHQGQRYDQGSHVIGNVHVISGRPTSHGYYATTRGSLRDALAEAERVVREGGHVHVNCSQGRVRSASFVTVLLARLGEASTAPELLQRLVDLRPQVLGGMEGSENCLCLLEHARMELEMRHRMDPDQVRNVRWV